MKILVKGNSGCSIEIVQKGTNLILQKGSSNIAYIPRLLKQFEKQSQFKIHSNNHIKIPIIYEIHKTSNSIVGKMEYVYSKNFINFFETAGFEQIQHFANVIIQFLDYEVSKSPQKKISKSTLINKIRTIKQNISSVDMTTHNLLKRVEKECLSQSVISIPVGLCHGDLTLSNILFNGSDCFLIDFLDSYIESPLMDIVKIRQDTYFGWSQLMSRQQFDKIRLNLILKKIDRLVDEHFQQYEWYVQYYRIFQIINFCRIIPYARNKRVDIFLQKTIGQLLSE
ncbi:phosphotransferase [Candidatus Saccharibacteria bacterium]|nr:phosphotransferase [Candidatus Saccharibacteria bacterium]